jgi:hypothetical protein
MVAAREQHHDALGGQDPARPALSLVRSGPDSVTGLPGAGANVRSGPAPFRIDWPALCTHTRPPPGLTAIMVARAITRAGAFAAGMNTTRPTALTHADMGI